MLLDMLPVLVKYMSGDTAYDRVPSSEAGGVTGAPGTDGPPHRPRARHLSQSVTPSHTARTTYRRRRHALAEVDEQVRV
ncbi:hypothetical protein [Streptomyces sp. NPDC058735]|uniref:hypothetical protein n=1 Tax=unclassified Streptomyces TaxID=2593676 RepID=UPI0036B6D823